MRNVTFLATTLVAAACALVGSAAADPAPAAPDFWGNTPSRGVYNSQELAASSAQRPIEPGDVIEFRFGSSALDDADRTQLQAAAQWLRAHPEYRLVVEAHTDAVGADTYNLGLASRRAQAVREELERRGIARSRVLATVYGESKPVSAIPTAGANRVVVMYATKLSPTEIARRSLPPSTAVIGV
ncbi:MAG: OmpA family protein [Kofleriaceae bacterium]